MRQWRRRRREDEQQVRRVSGAWPPPRGPFPTTVPCAHPRPHCRRRKLRHRPQSLTRVRSGRPCAASGHEGVRDEGCRGLRDPRVVRTQGEVRCPGGRRWPCGPEGDFGKPRPSAGYPRRGGAETSAVWLFPQPGRPATEFSISHTPLWPKQVTFPLSLSFLICKVGTVTEPMLQSCEDAVR